MSSQGKTQRNSEPAAKVEVLLSTPVPNAGLNVSGFVVEGRLAKGMKCKHGNVVYTVLRVRTSGSGLRTPMGLTGESLSCLLETTSPMRSIAEKTLLTFFTVPGGGGGGDGGGGPTGPSIPKSDGKSSDIIPKSNDEPPER